jgi:hypothetical protein
MQTTYFILISPKDLIILARRISPVRNGCISGRNRKFKIQITTDRHRISIAESSTIELALVADAALIFKVVFSGF